MVTNRAVIVLLLWLYAVASFIHHPPACRSSRRSQTAIGPIRSHFIHATSLHATSLHATPSALPVDILPVEILQALTPSERGVDGVATVLSELLYACRIIGTKTRSETFVLMEFDNVVSNR